MFGRFAAGVKPVVFQYNCSDLIKIEHKPFENMTGEFENENDTHEAWRTNRNISHIDHVRDLRTECDQQASNDTATNLLNISH